MLENINFESSGLKLFGVLAYKKTCRQGVIFLHGGGQSSSKRFEFLQNYFLDQDIASLAIDFRGCGLSEGNFKDASLANRIIDAGEAIHFFSKKDRPGFISNIYLGFKHGRSRRLQNFR